MRHKLITIAIVAILALGIQFGMSGILSNYEGTDDQSVSTIQQINPDFNPIINPLWEPKSDHQETLMFGLQTFIGASVIGLYIVYSERKKKANSCK